MSSPDLFAWADEQAIPESRVIEFRTRRERLRRWQWLEENKPFRHINLVIDRQDGRASPVQLYRLQSSRLEPNARSGASGKIKDNARVG